MKKRVSILLILTVLPMVAFAAKWQEIAPQQVYSLMREGSGLWLIDVRGPQSFEAVHIEGSVNIPPNALAVKTFPKQKILVVVDNALGNQQAREAADLLVKNGQKRVYVLTGGVSGWEQAKQPLVGDGLNWPLRQVMPQELAQAKQRKVRVELFDLRDENDYVARPLADATILPGKTLDERLEKLSKRLARPQPKSLAENLKQAPVNVVVLPADVDAKRVYQQQLWRLPGDVRVLDAAYLAVRSGAHQRSSSGKGCAACPGG